MNFTSNLKSIIIKVTNLEFIISIFAIKNVINIYKKIIVFGVKNIQVKNLAKNVKKCQQNIFY